MATVINLTLPETGEWVDVNTLTGIPVGTDLALQCTGVNWLKLQESDTVPATLDQGNILTGVASTSSEAIVTNSPLRLWARSSSSNKTAELAVQAI